MSLDRELTDTSHPSLPASPRRTIVVVILAMFSGLATIFVVKNSRSEVHEGILQAEQTRVLARRTGTVATLLVQEDDLIEPKQPIAQMIDSQLDADLNVVRAEIDALQAELKQTQAAAIVNRLLTAQPLDKDIHDTQLQLATLLQDSFRNKLETAAWDDYQDEPERFENVMFSENVPSPVSWIPTTIGEAFVRSALRKEETQNTAEVLRVKINLCEKRLTGLREQRTLLMQNVAISTGSKTVQARLDQATVRMHGLEQNQRDLVLKATSYGVAGVFRVKVGDRVTVGTPIVSILDRDKSFVVVRVPSQLAAYIETGSTVHVHFPGTSRRTGKIKAVPLQTDPDATLAKTSQLNLTILHTGKAWPAPPVGTSVGVSFLD